MRTDSLKRGTSNGWRLSRYLLLALLPLRLAAQDQPPPALPELVITGVAPYRVEADIAVASIRFESDHPVLEIADSKLELHGDLHGKADGSGYRIVFTGKEGTLQFVSAATVTGAIEGPGTATIAVDGASLVFNGIWQGAGTRESSSAVQLRGASSFYVGPDALLNNQQSDGVNASHFAIAGSGLNSIIELDPGFKADRGNFPSMEQWQPTGFSLLAISNATLVTHATQSLPAIHKRTASGHHAHHGLITFDEGTNNQWIVRGAAQTYDGAVLIRRRLTIETEKDLILTGRYTPESGVYFGSLAADPTEIVKRGAGRLAIMGTQAFAPGSRFIAAQGTTLWSTDPTFPKRNLTDRQGHTIPTRAPRLTIANGATVRLSHAPAYRFMMIESDGILHIDAPALLVEKEMLLAPFSSIVIPARLLDERRPIVTSKGPVTLKGRLVIEGNVAPGSYRIFDSPTISGEVLVETEYKQPAHLEGGNLIVEAIAIPAEIPTDSP